jgi:hypothetical protein
MDSNGFGTSGPERVLGPVPEPELAWALGQERDLIGTFHLNWNQQPCHRKPNRRRPWCSRKYCSHRRNGENAGERTGAYGRHHRDRMMFHMQELQSRNNSWLWRSATSRSKSAEVRNR